MNQKLNQHTPGPWIATAFHDDRALGLSANGYEIGGHPDDNNGFSVAVVSGSADMHANARLIAAAPNLLAELKEWSEYAVNRDIPFALIQATRSAIAKATAK